MSNWHSKLNVCDNCVNHSIRLTNWMNRCLGINSILIKVFYPYLYMCIVRDMLRYEAIAKTSNQLWLLECRRLNIMTIIIKRLECDTHTHVLILFVDFASTKKYNFLRKYLFMVRTDDFICTGSCCVPRLNLLLIFIASSV